MIKTQRLILKGIEEIDELEIIKWRNQKRVLDNLFSCIGPTLSEHRRWFEKYSTSKDRIEFIIVINGQNKKVGTIGLSNIDYKNQKAEYGIIIGEEDELGKGYAKEATQAILKYGFEELNLRKIYLRVFSDNTGALNLYKKTCFKQEGLLKEDIYKGGKFKDIVIMSVFKEEWKIKNV